MHANGTVIVQVRLFCLTVNEYITKELKNKIKEPVFVTIDQFNIGSLISSLKTTYELFIRIEECGFFIQ